MHLVNAHQQKMAALNNFYVQNDVTIRQSRSTEWKYKRTNVERPVVNEQNPHTRASW